jgi:carotenoid cleavage dioxygenase-like enzyme
MFTVHHEIWNKNLLNEITYLTLEMSTNLLEELIPYYPSVNRNISLITINPKTLQKTEISKFQTENNQYTHSFGRTENYVLVPLWSMNVNIVKIFLDGNVNNGYYLSDNPTTFAVYDIRKDIWITCKNENIYDKYQKYIAYHHFSLLDDGNENLIYDVVAYEKNNKFHPLKFMTVNDFAWPNSILLRYIINLKTSTFTIVNLTPSELMHVTMEFPISNGNQLYISMIQHGIVCLEKNNQSYTLKKMLNEKQISQMLKDKYPILPYLDNIFVGESVILDKEVMVPIYDQKLNKTLLIIFDLYLDSILSVIDSDKDNFWIPWIIHSTFLKN